MAFPLVDKLMADVRQRHPKSLQGIEEARAVHPPRLDAITEMFLEWAARARGEAALAPMLDAFVRFSYDVNLAQARYEAEGRYEHATFAECLAACYGQDDFMHDYLWGIYLTTVLWAHHAEICLFFEDQFVSRLDPAAALVELAPGHGGWGVWALHRLARARLRGFDISAEAIRIAGMVSRAAGVSDRASYAQCDALAVPADVDGTADAVICSFLVEHLEQPEQLFTRIASLLRRRGLAFVTGALTAAQIDHIYEFRRESELVTLSERCGLRVLASLSAAPRRTLPGAVFLPRSMALVVMRRENEFS